jgi:hypothetical protein
MGYYSVGDDDLTLLLAKVMTNLELADGNQFADYY